MMLNKRRFCLTVFVIGCTVLSIDRSTRAVAAEGGLACMEPRILDADPKTPFDKLPKIYAAPTNGSSVAATTSSIVYAVKPIEQNGGFTKVVRLNGKSGWVATEDLIPWHNLNSPTATCFGELRPNGTPHAVYHQ